MIEELNGENDEAKLLRIRTKKNELVIVPGEPLCICYERTVLIVDRCQIPAGCDT